MLLVLINQMRGSVKWSAAAIGSNAKFIRDDIGNLNNLKDQNFSVVYTRFYTLNKWIRTGKLFKDVYGLLNEVINLWLKLELIRTKCAARVKSWKNEYVTDHYRRFNNSKYLLKFILNTDFKLEHFIEKKD